MKTTSKRETTTLNIILFDNGIASFRAKPSMTREFTLKDVREIHAEIITFNRVNRLFLIHIENGMYSLEARKYLANVEKTLADKIAMVAQKPLQKVVGNFFLGINRPPIPIKLFTNQDEAKEWLLLKA
ncbi:MAG: STAS/SEC14 domain-containing protein [Crocinitomicaceae bacterium]|nr:STAS/SEC14 domain-containing protein [Crocinitomicaceae bacterium]